MIIPESRVMSYKQLTLFDHTTRKSSFGGLRQREKHFERPEKVYGQFLTPPEVADFIVRFLVANTEGNLGIDPACGDGVFLEALIEAGFEDVVGIDIDPKILDNLPLEVESKARIILGNGLTSFASLEGLGTAVVGNPPFSAKYGRVSDKAILSKFELGKGRSSQAIEVLFLERFLQFASSKGVIGIIEPQGIFSALPMEYVRAYITNKATVLGVISLPRGIFSNGTTSKTCILLARKGKKKVKTFMGIAEHLGDLPILLEAYIEHQELEYPPSFWVNLRSDTFEPEFYWSSKTIQPLFKPELPVVPLGELLSEMRCGGTEYGEKRKFVNEGIRFISAKTITPLGIDFSRDEKYVEPNSPMDKKGAYVFRGDVLFVRVGVGCSGRAAALVDDLQTGIADDWIYILRPKTISPFYLALFFYTKPGSMQVDRLKRGVGTVNIPQKLLKRVLVPIPPESFQQYVEIGYQEMVKLRAAGYISEAQEKFAQMKASIETMVTQLPITSVSPSLVGKTAQPKQIVEWEPSMPILFDTIRAFSIASEKHHEDMIDVLKRILGI